MAWDERIDELQRRRQWAEALGGEANVARHREQGRLTVRERIARLTDAGSFQEVGMLTGSGQYEDGKLVGVTPAPYVMGIARIDGRPVAIGGADFTVKGGISWGPDRRKGGQGGFIEDLAHRYRIPLVNLIDGSGGSVTSAKNGLDFKIAWPSAEWGSLPLEGGVAAAYRREIEAAPDPKAREAELEAELRALASPFRTAEAFAVEDIVDPRETRPYLCRFVEAAQARIRTTLGPKLRAGVRP
jgi:acetyl-CoA carboxylase carboxyltransferase component